MSKMRKICLVGGTGFVGRHLANALVKQNWQIKILTRHREKHRDLFVLPTVDVIATDVYDQLKLNEELADQSVVVNLVGILNERGKDGQGFYQAHVELTKKILIACQVNNINRLLHMSALNADAENGTSHYLRTKGQGENLVHSQEGLNVTSFRPSVIFGEDDSFFNRFVELLKLSPIMPLACPDSKFAPIWVQDVVQAMMMTIDDPQHYGQRYNLCGPKVYTLKELVKYTSNLIGKRRYVMGLGDNLSRMQARVFEFFPGKPLSMDNYRSLQQDSICEQNDLIEKLGIVPYSIETVMSQRFTNQSPRSEYSNLRHQARHD